MMELVDEADRRATQLRAFIVAHARRRASAADQRLAAVLPLQQARDMEQRRFARARWRDQRHRLAGIEGEVDVDENIEARLAFAIVAGDAAKLENGVAHALAHSCRSASIGSSERRLPGGIDRGENGEDQRHDDDHRHLARIDDRRQARQEIELRRKQIGVDELVEHDPDRVQILGERQTEQKAARSFRRRRSTRR